MLVLPLAAVKSTASPTLWYVTRLMAVSGYVTLTLAIVFGLMRSIARTAGERISWLVDEAHQFLAVLAGMLIAIHIATLLVDPFLPFSVSNLFIPGAQPYRATAVNLGVFALYTLIAILLSSWLKRSISHTVWRALHYLGFVAFALVTAHGLLAGTDSTQLWMRAVYAGAASAVGFMTLLRLFPGRRTPVAAGSR